VLENIAIVEGAESLENHKPVILSVHLMIPTKIYGVVADLGNFVCVVLFIRWGENEGLVKIKYHVNCGLVTNDGWHLDRN
jgi:hypothetical protein